MVATLEDSDVDVGQARCKRGLHVWELDGEVTDLDVGELVCVVCGARWRLRDPERDSGRIV